MDFKSLPTRDAVCFLEGPIPARPLVLCWGWPFRKWTEASRFQTKTDFKKEGTRALGRGWWT